MSEHVFSVTDAAFETEVLNADKPVLVDFWAEWCGPCKMITPIIEEIAKEYESKLKVVKVNVDDNHATATKYGIRGIPSLLIIKNGQVVASKVGALSKSQLSVFVDSHI